MLWNHHKARTLLKEVCFMKATATAAYCFLCPTSTMTLNLNLKSLQDTWKTGTGDSIAGQNRYNKAKARCEDFRKERLKPAVKSGCGLTTTRLLRRNNTLTTPPMDFSLVHSREWAPIIVCRIHSPTTKNQTAIDTLRPLIEPL